MHIMNHYGIELQGKRGDRHRKKHGCWKTAFHADAWTECNCNYLPFTYKRSADRCREAEIIVAAIGRANHITADMIAEGAVVADVGINVLEDGTSVEMWTTEMSGKKYPDITPVPGGVGNVTTSVLASHVLRAARIGRNEHGQRRG